MGCLDALVATAAATANFVVSLIVYGESARSLTRLCRRYRRKALEERQSV